MRGGVEVGIVVMLVVIVIGVQYWRHRSLRSLIESLGWGLGAIVLILWQAVGSSLEGPASVALNMAAAIVFFAVAVLIGRWALAEVLGSG